ncbi:MAG: slipin family protein [Deltaproteobacteria bacterium]|nr:slipin family protein [Deltaproteobacteria bacterium]
MIQPLTVFVVILVLIALSGIKIVQEYERGVIFRLGRAVGTRGPGIIVVIPFIESMRRIDLRTVTMDIPAQEVITRDNVSVKVSAVLYFRVVEPMSAVIAIENYVYGSNMIAQTTLRSVCGQVELDELLAEREKVNDQVQSIVDQQTEPWGVKVSTVEIKDIDLPGEMQRAIARQAEAERERRAKVIAAEGEFQASQKLADAAAILATHPMALTLRYLQSLREIAGTNNSTTIFPVPIELIRPFLDGRRTDAE